MDLKGSSILIEDEDKSSLNAVVDGLRFHRKFRCWLRL
jgi:hypothetical protein